MTNDKEQQVARRYNAIFLPDNQYKINGWIIWSCRNWVCARLICSKYTMHHEEKILENAFKYCMNNTAICKRCIKKIDGDPLGIPLDKDTVETYCRVCYGIIQSTRV